MKLAILGSRGFPSTYGGYETLVRNLAPYLVEHGHDVTVYCRERAGTGRRWLTDGVECKWTPGLDSKSLSTLSYGASSHLDAMLGGYDAALVLNVANGFYLPLLRARGVPSVVNTDGIEWERGKWGKLARAIFYRGARLTARHADSLVADSRAIAAVWRRLFGVEPRFIPYGAPVISDPGDERIKQLGLVRRNYVLVVARLIPENNVDLALDALERMTPPASTVVVGSSNYRCETEARLRRLAAARRLQWLGHVSDQQLLMQLWWNCGAYVHGHSVGGTNPALLQALGAGAPTLALDTPFNREVIDHDDQLFLHSPEQLAQRLSRLLQSPLDQQRFSERGRRLVAERYSWPEVCDAYLAALRDAAERRAAPAGSWSPARAPAGG